MTKTLRGTVIAASLLLVAAGSFAGCCTAYKDALRRVGDVGPRIAEDIKPTDAGGEARKTEFLRLCDECRSLGGE